MTEPQNQYGFKYFDKSPDYNEDEDYEEYEFPSCPSNCCDGDCECDDCERCSMNGTTEPDSLYVAAS
jgi:hypothetical protein